jgi:1-acyl-sn-glycerol-3-phosphate acyltransferase
MSDDVELKPQVYTDERPKEYFDQFHGLVRGDEPGLGVYEGVRIVTLLHALVSFRARAYNTHNVPNGPVILAPNHGSFMDHFFTGVFLRRRVQFMGKSQMFKGFSGWFFSHGGVFPVRRGRHDEEAFATAFTILERGGPVVMYCEGGRTRTGQLAERAKPGIGRLALESGVPVVPVAILGSHRVRNWKRLRFPQVSVIFGRPFRLQRIEYTDRDQQQAAADLIFSHIRELFGALSEAGHSGAPALARERRRLRADELAANRSSPPAPPPARAR